MASICPSFDNNLLTGGSSSRFGITVPGNRDFDRAILLKFTQSGDTLWLKKLPILGDVYKLHPIGNGLTWAVCQVLNPNTDPLNNFYFPAVFLLANDSAIVSHNQFPDMNRFELTDSYPTVDGGLMVFGQRSPSFIPGNELDFYAFRLSPAGQLLWSRAYSPGNSFCQGGRIEPMANGRYLVSGSMGSRIVSFEIDPISGADTNIVQWYQTPTNHIFDVPAVRQAPDTLRKVTGTKRIMAPNPSRFYFGNHRRPNQKLWGGEQIGGALAPLQNDDGSCILVYGTNTNDGFISRINQDSSIAWHISSTNNSQIPGRKVFYDCLYFPNQTGILVGYNRQQGQSTNFYIAKFSGMGIPFDPLGVYQPHLVGKDAIAFPNPSSGSFRFQKSFSQGEIHLYDLQGKHLLSQSLKPEKEIDISKLASGMYLYRATLDGRPHAGKILKK